MENLLQNKGQRPVSEGILVLDYGSQYTLLITRKLREIGIYAEVIDGQSISPPPPHIYDIKGIILSGGPDSLKGTSFRKLPLWVSEKKVPILGICYGMQLLVEHFGGKIQSDRSREYGRATLRLDGELAGPGGKLFYGMPVEQSVWMSHGDDVQSLPGSFSAVGHTEGGVCAVICHEELPIVGLQFHPEVHHTDNGLEILKKFAFSLCRMKSNWDGPEILSSTLDSIKDTVDSGNVLIAVSGGVDSTVCAALLAEALGKERVTAVLVDHGMMRQEEVPWVVKNLKSLGLCHLDVIDKKDGFLKALEGITDPEQKRKVIGRKFIETFEEYAKSHGPFTHLGQGTLYPDVIESAGHGSGSKVIKTHHNVGGLPEKLHLKLVEPLRFLFKDEVRILGKQLQTIPDELLFRHPFPGPGLSVRILGAITEERLDMLRRADDIFIKALKKADLYSKVWQAFSVLLPIKTVGVMGDNRSYQQTIALRAVGSVDGMTANVSELPMNFLTEVSRQIVRDVHGINRVCYDITDKPPATIEWE